MMWSELSAGCENCQKAVLFVFVAGIQLRFADLEERKQMQEYVAYDKEKV